MSLETIMWLFITAAASQVVERYVMYQRGWSGSYGEPITRGKSLLSLAIIVPGGAYFAINASTQPEFALVGGIGILVSVAAFQLMPQLRSGKWCYVPGLASELLLLCPLAIAAIWRSLADGHLTTQGLFLFSGPLIGSLLGVWWATKKQAMPPLPPIPPGPFGD